MRTSWKSLDSKVDPIGACVGVRGSRIRNIIDELNGEKVDILKYEEQPEIMIATALKPAQINSITLNWDESQADVLVDEDQLSLAIGRRGANVRLASKLSGWEINISGDQATMPLEEAKAPEGEAPEGEAAEGEAAEGEAAEGEAPEGEAAPTESPEGATPAVAEAAAETADATEVAEAPLETAGTAEETGPDGASEVEAAATEPVAEVEDPKEGSTTTN